MGIADSLIRLSIGIEDLEDLIRRFQAGVGVVRVAGRGHEVTGHESRVTGRVSRVACLRITGHVRVMVHPPHPHHPSPCLIEPPRRRERQVKHQSQTMWNEEFSAALKTL